MTYRVYRRRWPMIPALALGLLQIAAGIDTLFTHLALPAAPSVATNIAAGLFIALGLVMIIVVLANLYGTPPIIEATDEALFLGITAPGQPPVKIPWDALKAVELGRVGAAKNPKDDSLCLIFRFAGARVPRPPKLSVFHSTKGSLYIRGSMLPALDPIVERLNALMREHGGAPPTDDADAVTTSVVSEPND
jgi:hypothetical protein